MSRGAGLREFCALSGALLGLEIDVRDFRLAETGRNVVSSICRLWNVLHGLTCHKSSCSDDIVTCTKENIARALYRRIQFYLLPKDKTQGSLELIFAICWTIFKGGIEKKMDSLLLMNPFFNDTLGKEVITENQDVSDEYLPSGSSDSMSCIMRIAGKIKLKLNFVEDLLLQRSNLIGKINQDNTSFIISNRISLLRLLVISRNHFVHTDKSWHSLIKLYVQWTLKAKHFFSWFENVYNNFTETQDHIRLSDSQIGEFTSIKTVSNGFLMSTTRNDQYDNDFKDVCGNGAAGDLMKTTGCQPLNLLYEFDYLLNDLKETLNNITIIEE